MIHHAKGCVVDFASDVVLLHCGINDLKKYLTTQRIAQNILKFAEKVYDGGKRDVLISGIINRVDDFNAKVQKISLCEMCPNTEQKKLCIWTHFMPCVSEIRNSKNVKYIDNGNISLGMLNWSKLHLSKFGTI